MDRKTSTYQTVSRGGRMTKWKGRVASYAPSVALALTIVAGGDNIAFADVIVGNETSLYYLDIDEDLQVTNSGSISVINGPTDESALFGDGGFEGSVTNEGTIGNWASDGYISAVEIGGDLFGAITNNDDIVADVEAIDDQVGAVGIYLDSDVELGGAIDNNGDISATAGMSGTGFGQLYAEAIGVDVYDIYGDVTNAGNVTAEATLIGDTTNDGDVYAAGFQFETLYGSFENTGDITATASQTGAYCDTCGYSGNAETWVEAYAIDAGNIEGSFVSTGDVTAEVNMTNVEENYYGSNGEAYAISFGDVDGSAELDGNIRATVNATDAYLADVYAYGVAAYDIHGSVTSTANVTVDIDHDDYGYSEAAGFYANWVNGLLQTSGDVDVTVEVFDTADASGIFVDYGVGNDGTVANLGDITVSASSEIDYAYVAGIAVDETIYGTVVNEGMLDVSATAESAFGYGIYAYDVNEGGTISNVGDISVDVAQYREDYGYSLVGAGIWVDNRVTDGLLVNSGSIETTVTADSDDATLFAGGIHVNGDMGADPMYNALVSAPGVAEIVNIGDITVDARNTGLYDTNEHGDVTAAGISVGNDVMNLVSFGGGGSVATIDNQGTINVTADGKDDDGDVLAAGIGIMGNIGDYAAFVAAPGPLPVGNGHGDVLNSGLIDVSASSTDYAAASGIHIGGAALNGEIYNAATGQIEVDASGAYVDANGLSIDSDLAMRGLNDGSFDVTARSTTSYAVAQGVFVRGDVLSGGSFVNAGDMNISSFSVDDTASASGLVAAVQLDGALVNEGYIEVGAISLGLGDQADAFGLYGYDIGFGGLLENAGELVVTATGDNAYSVGLLSEDNYGTQTNSGNILVTATSDLGLARAYGLRSNQVYSNLTLSNTGYMEVSASANDGPATAVGIGADTVYGTSSNSGEMVIWSDGAEQHSSNGILVGEVALGGTVENTGIIRVDSADGSSFGINIGTLDGTLMQSGMIDAPLDQYAIYVGGGQGTAYLDAKGHITGRLEFNNNEVVLRSAPNQSVNWTVEGSSAVILDEESGIPWFVNGNQYATFDTSGVVGLNNAAMGISRLGFSANLLADRPAAEGVTVSSKGGWNNNTSGAWVYGQTSQLDFDGGEVSLDQAVRSSSLTVGYTGQMENGLTFSLLAGGAQGNVGSDSLFSPSYGADFSGAFGGIVVSKQIGATNLAFGLMAGSLNNQATRTVNDNTLLGGIDTLTSEFGTQFITPEIALSHTIGSAAGGWSVTPGVRVRYASMSVDGYSETGSNAANEATVDSYNVGMTEVEASVAMAHDFSFGTLTGTLGVLSRNAASASTSVELIGDVNDVPMLYNDSTFGTVGVNLSIPVSTNGSFQVGAEAVFGGGATDVGYNANVGFALRF
jgi:hypothetical protein